MVDKKKTNGSVESGVEEETLKSKTVARNSRRGVARWLGAGAAVIVGTVATISKGAKAQLPPPPPPPPPPK